MRSVGGLALLGCLIGTAFGQTTLSVMPTGLLGGATIVKAVAPPDGNGAAHYEFSWGDGQTSTTDSPSASHSYAVAGSYDVSVQARDGGGLHELGRQTVALRAAQVDSYQGPKHPGFGFVAFRTPLDHPIVALSTVLTVSAPPDGPGVLFLWPGLAPLGHGVLQSVLTWGRSCAPTDQPPAHTRWWISAQYVNGRDHLGCASGPAMNVNVGDRLNIAFTLSGTIWHQQVTDEASGRSVGFDYDLNGEPQNRAYIQIETFSNYPAVPVVFSDTVIRWSGAAADLCFPQVIGQSDAMTMPMASADGSSCKIDTITLRAPGVR